MARALSSLPLAAVMGSAAVMSSALGMACFHATPYSPTAAQEQWRSMRDEEAARASATAASAATGPGLTADETYALALAHSPDVMALSAMTDAATAEIQAERQLENPQLRLTSFNIDDVVANQPALNIGLRMPIPRPGTVRARVAGAEGAAEGQRNLTEDAKRLLREQVDLLFAQLAVLSADLEHATRAAELQAERREQLDVRAGHSVSTRVDVALAAVEEAEVREDLVELRDAIALTQEQLARLAGIRGPVRFEIDPELVRPAEPVERDLLIERALASRPELRTAHAFVVEAEAEAHVARAEAWPWFDWVQLQYRAAPGSTPTAFGLGVSITLPVLSWNRGAIKASKALVRQRKAEQDARIVAIADEVDAAAALVERTRERVLALERELLPAVEVATHEARSALASGTIDALDANEVEIKAVAAKRTHLAALLEHRQAVVALEALVGGSPGDLPK
jgi:cobalt-zinc-cadmium efflux system outer membrane protein